ncbi:malonyl CoA-acyl carrier protein transacylase [Halomonas elongata]|uniref:[acyl-carrier-protein] S-malonyltransferase n=1 Tax=Halomonas elongata TaxID=2746 RepID=A0A1B8P4I9_HALEL|nr:malonyl CoA-acyl carrier protein transacylase [Halomonas elongata]
MAGHSLGEYSAMVCAGALPFAEGVRLVKLRGEAMQDAVPMGEGAMAAVLGLDDDTVEAACAKAAEGDVVAAVNYNAPGQVVIAGSKAAVDRAIAACQEAGAKRAMPLPVSVPSHCDLMRPAADRLAEAMASIDLRAPRYTVIQNVDAEAHADVETLRTRLIEQLYQPVRWTSCVEALSGLGAEVFIECGPGKVLTGLNKRIARGSRGLSVNDPDSLTAALELAAKRLASRRRPMADTLSRTRMEESMTTERRVALITGASRGIGRAIAHELGRQGRIVIGTATSDAGAERIDADLKEHGIEGAGRRLDVTDQQSVDALIKSIGEEFGAPTILVNNAGSRATIC